MPTPPPIGDFVLALFKPEVTRDTPFNVGYHYIPKPDEQPRNFHFSVEAVYPKSSDGPQNVRLSCARVTVEPRGNMVWTSLEGCRLSPKEDGDLCKLKINVTTSNQEGGLTKTLETPEIRVVAK